jgi:DNA-binding NtrC family response regulator
MPELAFFRHGEELMRVALGDRTEIGRAPECDVSLPDPLVSRLHAVIERRADVFFLIDHSGRGTRVGSENRSEAPLVDGSEIAIGSWRALFRVATATADSPTRAGGQTEVRPSPATGPAAPARLRIRQGGRERVVSLDGAGLALGKDPANDVVLEDPFVSAYHLRIDRRESGWQLRDLGSTNGTRLGGARVTQVELPVGMPVQVGDCELVLEIGPPREARAAGSFEGMLSGDAAMRQVFDLIERVAPSDAAVTIFGETGTGKELVARALHARSPRRAAPFVPVNCSAIAASLIESELFGHEKGAFSGADRMRKGAFEEADGGTIFLDEIGELPLDLQPKLLRALELGEVKRVGASRPVHVTTRIVAATHRDLRALVRSRQFREDLYYRLSVVPLSIPPLRARAGDTRALAEQFLHSMAPRGLGLRWGPDALEKLQSYDWPGNIRQLKNVVQRALLFRGEGLTVPASAVTFEDTRTAAGSGDSDSLYLPGLTLEDIEREAIRLSLRRHRGKRAAVVKELQIAKSTVMKRIGQWSLQDEGRAPGSTLHEEEAQLE